MADTNAIPQKCLLKGRDVAAVAVVAGVAPATVVRRLAGLPVRARNAERITTALDTLGLAPGPVLDVAPPMPTAGGTR